MKARSLLLRAHELRRIEIPNRWAIPSNREDGALVWTTESPPPDVLRKAGWHVVSFRDLLGIYIKPAQLTGVQRSSLTNPAQPLLDLIRSRPLAVLGVVAKTAADIRDVYAYLVEPAYRARQSLLVSTDLDIADIDPSRVVESLGYAWTLERLVYVADRIRLGNAAIGVPFTPIESRLYEALRARLLEPIAQFGVGQLRLDFAFPEARLGVECDGREWHDAVRDAARDLKLKHRGWEVIHFSGTAINRDAAGCAEIVANQLSLRQELLRSEAPKVDLRPTIWMRLKARLRSLLGHRQSADGELDGAELDSPVVGPASLAPGLDPEQRAAVSAHDGVVQVIAPAGSGKTTVLVARVRELLSRGAAPNRILCCTFNKAAARELDKRLQRMAATGVDASTFHGVGRRILDDSGQLRPNIGSMTQNQFRRLAKLAMDGAEDGVWIEPGDAQDGISNIKLAHLLTPDQWEPMAKTPTERTLARLYRMYEDQLAEQERNDFDDLIFRSVAILRADPVLRERWQAMYDVVLVDEYQDVEPAQEMLVQILAAPQDDLFSVGDEDQCLYAWRRASVERVIELDQAYPGLERHALARNYRSVTRVVDASRNLIVNNRRRFPKRIEAARSERGNITVVQAADLAAQARHVARLVEGMEQGQVVVLARATSVLREIASELAHAGIRFFGPARLKGQSGVYATLLAYLRLFGNPADARPEDVKTVFRVPNRYLPDGTEHGVASALRAGMNFEAALARVPTREQWRRQRLSEGALLLDRLLQTSDATAFVRLLRSSGGLDRHYGEAEALRPTDRSDTDLLATAEQRAQGMTVAEFADALDRETQIIEQNFDESGIELTTIHGSKGREWPLVIVVGMDDGVMPHQRSIEGTKDLAGAMEDERRLAYVAFTRAAERLVILHTAGAASPFIAEAAMDAETVDIRPVPEAAKASRTSWPSQMTTDDDVEPTGPVRPFPPRHADAPQRDDSPSPSDAFESVDADSAPEEVDPVALAHATIQDRVPPYRPAGSITCSITGCGGVVNPGFVIETTAGSVGICGQRARHEMLAASNGNANRQLQQLRELQKFHQRKWAEKHRDEWVEQILVAGGVRCSLEGCSGVVKPEYVGYIDGERVGLCGLRDDHERLIEHDPKLTPRYQELEAASR